MAKSNYKILSQVWDQLKDKPKKVTQDKAWTDFIRVFIRTARSQGFNGYNKYLMQYAEKKVFGEVIPYSLETNINAKL